MTARSSSSRSRSATRFELAFGRAWRDYDGHVIFCVGVPDVEAALQKAESLGGTRTMGPDRAPGSDLVVGHFTDPEGHPIGLASTA
jgi:predicted enzyme related to lactoylglutathione lyase